MRAGLEKCVEYGQTDGMDKDILGRGTEKKGQGVSGTTKETERAEFKCMRESQ